MKTHRRILHTCRTIWKFSFPPVFSSFWWKSCITSSSIYNNYCKLVYGEYLQLALQANFLITTARLLCLANDSSPNPFYPSPPSLQISFDGLPRFFLYCGLHNNILLGQLPSSFLRTWPNHCSCFPTKISTTLDTFLNLL